MPTRPVQGGSNGTWGTELNAWLDAAVSPFDVYADYGAVGNGSTDDSSKIQNAINAASGAGGGIVRLGNAKTYAIASTLTLANDVLLFIDSGSTVKWTGSAAGTMFSSGTTNPLLRAGLVGPGTIDPNASAGIVFDLHSPQFCTFGNFDVLAGTATTIVMKISADTTNTSTFTGGSKNAVYNKIDHIYAAGTIGNLLVLSGDGTGFVTLNTFSALHAAAVNGVGIRFVQWCDNNTFMGSVRLGLAANNAVGIIFNDSATPTSNLGVYAEKFQDVAIDAYSTFTGRVGIKLNNCKQIQIDKFYQFPLAEGGSAVIDATAISYRINYIADTGTIDGNAIETWVQGSNFVQFDANAAPLGIKANNSAVTPELRVQNTANSGVGKISVIGATSGGTQIASEYTLAAGGSVLFGSTSSHDVLFIRGATEIFRAASTGLLFSSGKVLAFAEGAGPWLLSGSGAPASTAPSGSIYLRTDGTAGSRIYVNQNGSTTWTAISGV